MDPLAAEDWIRKTEKILNTMRIVNDDDRIRLASHQLDSEADQWWHDKKKTVNLEGMTWQGFKTLFLDKYFPPDGTGEKGGRIQVIRARKHDGRPILSS